MHTKVPAACREARGGAREAPGPVAFRAGRLTVAGMRKPWHDERATCALAPRDERWLQRTAKYAQDLEVPWPVACMIVRGSRVLAIGTVKLRNQITACADTPWRCSEHAEMNALRMVKDPKGATAYIVRVGADKQMRHAQPCRRCRAELERSGVRMVWSSE